MNSCNSEKKFLSTFINNLTVSFSILFNTMIPFLSQHYCTGGYRPINWGNTQRNCQLIHFVYTGGA